MDYNAKKLIEKEIKGCFDFFWETTNSDLNSKGYGLALDSTRKDEMASIAATGFALPAYMIGVERGYITFEQGYERVLNTIKTVKNNVANANGFYVHFIDNRTAERYEMCEYSTIDTAIFLVGAITVAEYFGKEVKTLVDEMLEETDWAWLVAPRFERPCFRMGYNPEAKGRWGSGDDGFLIGGWWDHYAEHLMMYILYAGQKNADKDLAIDLYSAFDRPLGSFEGENYVYSIGNALFIHQFSHAFFDFSKYTDRKNFDWFQNSVTATLANKATCEKILGLDENMWGLTAMHSPDGYYVTGGEPRGLGRANNADERLNVVAPYGPLSSMPFTPKESIDALLYIDENVPEMWGKYGLYDSFEKTENGYWVSETYLGIDKGPTIIMLDNYLNGTTWKYFMQSEFVQKAIETLDFKKR